MAQPNQQSLVGMHPDEDSQQYFLDPHQIDLPRIHLSIAEFLLQPKVVYHYTF